MRPVLCLILCLSLPAGADPLHPLETLRGGRFLPVVAPGQGPRVTLCLPDTGWRFDIRPGPPRFGGARCACVVAARHDLHLWPDAAMAPALRTTLDLRGLAGRTVWLMWQGGQGSVTAPPAAPPRCI